MSQVIASAQAENNGEIYSTTLQVQQHQLIADEPVEVGGKNAGPTPGDLLCMSLASCTAITLRMYAQRKKWEVDTIKIKVSLVKGTDMASGNNTFYCEVAVTGTLTEEQHNRLYEIAKACPVHRLLTKPSDVITVTM